MCLDFSGLYGSLCSSLSGWESISLEGPVGNQGDFISVAHGGTLSKVTVKKPISKPTGQWQLQFSNRTTRHLTFPFFFFFFNSVISKLSFYLL